MSTIVIVEHIDAPVERVYAVFTDFEHVQHRVDGIERLELLTEEPVGVGTRFRETRIFHGREATETIEISTFEPPSRYVAVCRSHGTCYHREFHFEPEPPGTRVTVSFRADPQTLLARCLAPLGRLMLGNVRRCLADDVADLKKAAETKPLSRRRPGQR